MTRAQIGVALRLIGPAIQVVCLLGLLRPEPEIPTPSSERLRQACIIGFGAGLLLVAVGLALSLTVRRGARPDPKDGGWE